MEALRSFPSSSVLQQRELRARSASSCSSSHFCGDLCLPCRRVTVSSRKSSAKARVQAEASVGQPLSSPCASKFAGNLATPSSLASHRRSSQIHAAKKTYSSFDDLLMTADTPLLVDFYATWCGPCQFMVPILDNVGQALKGRLRIVKIDSEKYPTIASRYGVQALPTLILFQNGKPVDRLEGALSAPDLIKRIEEVLSATSRAK